MLFSPVFGWKNIYKQFFTDEMSVFSEGKIVCTKRTFDRYYNPMMREAGIIFHTRMRKRDKGGRSGWGRQSVFTYPYLVMIFMMKVKEKMKWMDAGSTGFKDKKDAMRYVGKKSKPVDIKIKLFDE